jgi:hypothetical protein
MVLSMSEKLAAFRELLVLHEIEGYLIVSGDAHQVITHPSSFSSSQQSEYVSASEKRKVRILRGYGLRLS